VAAVVDEPMAEIDMGSSPEGEIDMAAPVRELPVHSTRGVNEAGDQSVV
jgi:hypothetical protein